MTDSHINLNIWEVQIPVQVVNDRFIREIQGLTSPSSGSQRPRKSLVFMPVQTFPSRADMPVLTLEVLPPVLLGLYLPGPASSVAPQLPLGLPSA